MFTRSTNVAVTIRGMWSKQWACLPLERVTTANMVKCQLSASWSLTLVIQLQLLFRPLKMLPFVNASIGAKCKPIRVAGKWREKEDIHVDSILVASNKICACLCNHVRPERWRASWEVVMITSNHCWVTSQSIDWWPSFIHCCAHSLFPHPLGLFIYLKCSQTRRWRRWWNCSYQFAQMWPFTRNHSLAIAWATQNHA